jgi:hypothetical protein
MRSDLQTIKELVELQKRILWDLQTYHGNIEHIGSEKDRAVREGVANAYMHAHDMLEDLEGAIQKLDEYNHARSM